ncbi:hypothetical protein DPMN_012406 [Dreissena polymorpha]|uniref:Uncharacterized protein n=1 Tax=Dreissena polymorpha TaxID=45954 RepID=A0A9D4S2S8_DREPO|nr:hypothetical protein DPMN_012406 [Dreissena polymorpha]
MAEGTVADLIDARNYVDSVMGRCGVAIECLTPESTRKRHRSHGSLDNDNLTVKKSKCESNINDRSFVHTKRQLYSQSNGNKNATQRQQSEPKSCTESASNKQMKSANIGNTEPSAKWNKCQN